MKRKLLAAFVTAACFLAGPMPAWARSDTIAREPIDARLETYGENKNVNLEASSTALTYFVFIGLSVLCLVGLFKNARRTHLD